MRTTEPAAQVFDMWATAPLDSDWLPGSSPLLPTPAPMTAASCPTPAAAKPALSTTGPKRTGGKALTWPSPAYITADLDQDSCDEIDPQKKRARAAQARFRAKQKDRKRDMELQLKMLVEQLQEITLDNKYLEYRNRRLRREISVNDAHLNRLSGHTAVRQVEQELVLQSLVKFINIIDGRPIDQASLDPTKTWSLQDLESFFQRYVLKLGAHLQAHSSGQPGSLAEVTKMVETRRHHLCLDPWYSNLYWVVLSWNLRQMELHPQTPPARHEMAQLLTKLELTQPQQQRLLTARQCLLTSLSKIGKKRCEIIGRLGMQALENPGESLESCPAAKDFAANLTCERETVVDFLFVIFDDILTPHQEAVCEVLSYPWSPDWLEMSNILAGRHGHSLELPESLKHLKSRSPGLNKLMPMITPFELLQKPLTTHGIGMALKRSVLMCPWQTATHSPYYRMLPLEKMRQMTLFHAHFGRFEDLIFSVCAVELPESAQRVLDSPQRSTPPPSPLRDSPASPLREAGIKPL